MLIDILPYFLIPTFNNWLYINEDWTDSLTCLKGIQAVLPSKWQHECNFTILVLINNGASHSSLFYSSYTKQIIFKQAAVDLSRTERLNLTISSCLLS